MTIWELWGLGAAALFAVACFLRWYQEPHHTDSAHSRPSGPGKQDW